MAASMPSAASSSSDDEDEKDQEQSLDELDFCSPKFNPIKALLSPDAKVPFENVKSFPSLALYEAAIKTVNRQSQSSSSSSKVGIDHGQQASSKTGTCKSASTSKNDADPRETLTSKAKQSIEPESHGSQHTSGFRFGDQRGRGRISHGERLGIDKATPLSSPSPPDFNRHNRNVLTRMAQMSGPLELLAKCVKNRIHVRVMTRAAISVRSICRGYVLAFDKYFNMALIDVDEIYRRPACLGKVRARRTHKLQAAQKTLREEREVQRARFNSSRIDPSETEVASTETSTSRWQFTKIKEAEKCQQTTKELKKDSSIKTDNLTGALMTAKTRKSVYDGIPAPYSNFEREALMLGIPDENVEHRHVNQMLIRGENVVLVSIID